MQAHRPTQCFGNRRERHPMRLGARGEACDCPVQCDRVVAVTERALEFAQSLGRSIGPACRLGFAFGGVAPFLDCDTGAMEGFVVGMEPGPACGAHRLQRLRAGGPHALVDFLARARIRDPVRRAVERARDIARHIAHAPWRDRGERVRAEAGVPGAQAALERPERRAFGG